jgi:opine dehydrogenase
MDIKKIAILGAGNGGFMCAADFASQGYEVRLFAAHKGKLDGVKKNGVIEVLDIDSKPTGVKGKISLASEDIAAVIKGADVVINPVPFFCDRKICKTGSGLSGRRSGRYFIRKGWSFTYLG